MIDISFCLKALLPFGRAGWGSSLVKMEENCWFRISTFPFASDTRVPFLHNLATARELFYLQFDKGPEAFQY